MELHRGDTILRHPDHLEQRGEWVVQSRRYAHAALVDVHYETPDGAAGVFCVDPVIDLIVRPEPRMAMVHGLRQAATWLEAHPDVPIGRHESVRIQHSVDNTTQGLEAQRAEVDRIAEAMGEQAAEQHGCHHYGVMKHFGPVFYYAVSTQDDQEVQP
jgi:hypothetical protein